MKTVITNAKNMSNNAIAKTNVVKINEPWTALLKQNYSVDELQARRLLQRHQQARLVLSQILLVLLLKLALPSWHGTCVGRALLLQKPDVQVPRCLRRPTQTSPATLKVAVLSQTTGVEFPRRSDYQVGGQGAVERSPSVPEAGAESVPFSGSEALAAETSDSVHGSCNDCRSIMLHKKYKSMIYLKDTCFDASTISTVF